MALFYSLTVASRVINIYIYINNYNINKDISFDFSCGNSFDNNKFSDSCTDEVDNSDNITNPLRKWALDSHVS